MIYLASVSLTLASGTSELTFSVCLVRAVNYRRVILCSEDLETMIMYVASVAEDTRKEHLLKIHVLVAMMVTLTDVVRSRCRMELLQIDVER